MLKFASPKRDEVEEEEEELVATEGKREKDHEGSGVGAPRNPYSETYRVAMRISRGRNNTQICVLC